MVEFGVCGECSALQFQSLNCEFVTSCSFLKGDGPSRECLEPWTACLLRNRLSLASARLPVVEFGVYAVSAQHCNRSIKPGWQCWYWFLCCCGETSNKTNGVHTKQDKPTLHLSLPISAAASQPQLVQHQAMLMMVYLSQLCFQCTGLHLRICSNQQNSKGIHLKMMQITLYPCQQSSKRRRRNKKTQCSLCCLAQTPHPSPPAPLPIAPPYKNIMNQPPY